MNGFQILALLVLGPASIWSLYSGARHGRRKQLLLTLVFGTALFFILRPGLATAAARFLGIGRGADLVTYLAALAVVGCYALIFTFERRIRIQITELTRAIALIELPTGLAGQPEKPVTLQPGPSPGA